MTYGGKTMPIKLNKFYLKNIRERYKKSTKKLKTVILSEFCVNSGYSRKHASRILNGVLEPRKNKSGPKLQYNSDEFLKYLKILWEAMNRMCGKNMVVALPIWLPKFPEKIPQTIIDELLSISASTIDRRLKQFKNTKPKGLSSTTASNLKHRIPVRTLDAHAECPGIVNADTVAHCGTSLSGDYANSLTIVDLYSAWTVNRAIWKKEAPPTLKQIKKAESLFPFSWVEFFSDNGNEFINYELEKYLTKRAVPVNFKRTRAYKKNDACYVEQKNYTHVRKIMNYKRIGERELVGLINEIYQVYWNPLQNYFTPTIKMEKKERIGSKIIKTYSKPKTPYQRLIECSYLSRLQKKALQTRFNNLDPFFLKRELDKKLKILFKKIEEYNRITNDRVA